MGKAAKVRTPIRKLTDLETRRQQVKARRRHAKQQAKEARMLLKEARKVAKRAKAELQVLSRKLKKLLAKAPPSKTRQVRRAMRKSHTPAR